MNKKVDQNGAVSIISVVIFATIITVVITAYLRSAISQNASALNYDYSTRALYTAESGVQDIVRSLKEGNKLGTDSRQEACLTGELDTDLNLNYTCQRYFVESKNFSGTTAVNKQSAIMKLEPKNTPNGTPQLVIRWSRKTDGTTQQTLYPRTVDYPYLSTVSGWNKDGDKSKPVHAMLRVSVIDTPKGAPTAIGARQRVSFFNPTSTRSEVDFSFPNILEKQQKELFTNASCKISTVGGYTDGENEYSCEQIINLAGYDFSGRDVYVRVSSLYRDTDFSVQLRSGDKSVVSLTNAQVTVDVTARAGDSVHRRVVQKVPLSNYKTIDMTTSGGTGGDAALIAGEGICKLISLGNSDASFSSECNPLSD